MAPSFNSFKTNIKLQINKAFSKSTVHFVSFPVDRVYPLTLGSNIGTTTTALLAALASGKSDPMQIALCHLIFNLSGILVFYPIPATRLPLVMCKQLGKITSKYRWFAVFYLIIMFFVIPGGVLGLSVAGQVPLLVVLAIIGVGLVLILSINLLQAKTPKLLPSILKNWHFLPLWMHSLEPLDQLVSALGKFCCICRRQKETPQTMDNRGQDNLALENECN